MKAFRKHRQGELSDNHKSQYLVYAVGEIVLVVLGILIALQVNNYNETRQKLKRKDEILRQVVDDLWRNRSDLKADLDMHLQGLKSNLKVTRYIEEDLPYGSELAFDFWYL